MALELRSGAQSRDSELVSNNRSLLFNKPRILSSVHFLLSCSALDPGRRPVQKHNAGISPVLEKPRRCIKAFRVSAKAPFSASSPLLTLGLGANYEITSLAKLE